ncbi:D-alanyl-D-alanine carboxypeptidase family protein [Gracilibacillus marinus]|uniref:serine-type D-Ala-D-Ala carboxypeptidase n=1 Tax=Gracilibacillus marinus TaxID=630535 RepID=A0ABV8VXF2_9BACI
MKKIVYMLLVLCFISIYFGGGLLANHHTPESESTLNLAENSKSAILIERDTGKVLYQKNADSILPPASMTKIMTMLLIMEALEEKKLTLDENVRISEKAASMGGSQIFLEAGEEMTVNDLLKGIAVASGNDASVALAERIAGSEEAFVEKMNNKAKELGLKNTTFKNSTGLPDTDHLSTASDMALMAKELLKYDEITKYTSIYEDYLRKGQDNEFWLVNTNKLVKFYDGVDGLKTGFTNEAKYCLTATAEKNGMRVIAVVMGANTTKERNSDVSQLLDFAYSKYATKTLFDKDQKVTDFKWIKANQKEVEIVTNDRISIVHEKGEDLDSVKTNIKMNQNITLPLKKGTSVGNLEIIKDNKVISSTDLIVSEDIKKANLVTLFGRTIQSFLRN